MPLPQPDLRLNTQPCSCDELTASMIQNHGLFGAGLTPSRKKEVRLLAQAKEKCCHTPKGKKII